MKLKFITLVLSCVWMAGCGVFVPAGGCRYQEDLGTAVIISIEPSRAGANTCPRDGVMVSARFAPNDSTLQQSEFTVEIGEGKDPARSWVEASKLDVGSRHPAVRMTSVAGACSPIVYRLTDVDYDAANAACF